MKKILIILLSLISISVNAQFIYNDGKSTAKVDTVRAKGTSAVLKGTFNLDGTMTGVTKAMVGVPNIDNTSDASKPVSTATQTALGAKADTSVTYPKTRLIKTTGPGTNYLSDDGSYKAVSGGGATWGSISGTLSSQTDLNAALNSKAANVISNYKTSISDISNGDSLKVAIGKLDGKIQASGISLPEVGQIINDDFNRVSLGSNWTTVGSTATWNVSSNQLQVSKTGALSMADHIYYSAYGKSNLESWTLSYNIIAGVIDANSHGVGVVIKGKGNYVQTTYFVGIDMANATTGKITLYNSSGTAIVTSYQGLPISQNDNLTLQVRYIKTKVIVCLTNNTTHSINTLNYNFSLAYPYTNLPSNSYELGILCLGGAHVIDNYNVVGNDVKFVDILGLGDSILKGATSDNPSNRALEIITGLSNIVTQTNAGTGNLIEDINISEVVALAPKKILLLIGINNIGSGENLATFQTKYQTLISSLASNGYTVGSNVFICTLLPHQTYNVTTYNAWLKSTYTTSVIDLYSALKSATTTMYSNYTFDGIHPNYLGNVKIADILINYFNIPTKPKKLGDYRPVLYDSQGYIGFGDGGYAPQSPYHFVNSWPQIQLGGTPNQWAACFGSKTNNNVYVTAGASYDFSSNQWIAQHPSPSFTMIDNGTFYFYANTGATSGNSFSPTLRTYINPSGNVITTGTVKGTQYILSALNTAPSSATDTGTAGEIRVTSGYIYVCTATNTWVRTALTTW